MSRVYDGRNEMSMLVQYCDERKLIYIHYKPLDIANA